MRFAEGPSVIFSSRCVHLDRRGAATIGLNDAGSVRHLDVLFVLREGPDEVEQRLGGGHQFEFGGRVDGFEFFGDQYLPGGRVGLGLQDVDRVSDIAVVAEPSLDERLQALIGVINGRLSGVGGSGYSFCGEASDDSVRDDIWCHGGGCNCATDQGPGEILLIVWRIALIAAQIRVEPSGQPPHAVKAASCRFVLQSFQVMCR
jgi:hypothetical protein